MSAGDAPGAGGSAPRPAPKLPVLPYLLLGLMSLAAFAGPFVIFVVVRGGDSPEWPPDRPLEWWVFGGITGAVLSLMAACVTVGVWSGPGKSSEQ